MYLNPEDNNTTNPSKQKPVTYLSIIYKTLTSCIAEKIETYMYTAIIDYKKA